jgi:hypothetical protein
MSEQHARLGPSDKTWPHCPAAPSAQEPYENIPGKAAVDGTGSHLLLELCLNHNVRAVAYLGEIIGAGHHDNPNGWMVHEDRVERVQTCLDYVENRVKKLRGDYPGSTVKVEAESKSNPGEFFGRDDWWGTCDITIVVLNAHGKCLFIEVIDYKDGRGFVPAKGNTQLISYLGGKVHPYIDEKLEIRIAYPCQMTIVQPKTTPPVRSDVIEHEDLFTELKKLAAAANATDQENPPFVPDNKGGKGHCRWCLHRENCTAMNERDIQELQIMTSSDNLPAEIDGGDLFTLANQLISDPEKMDSETLTRLADMEPGVTSIFQKAREEIEKRVRRKDDIDGWEIGFGQSSRVWNESEETVAKKLKSQRLKKDQIYPAKLISPAQYLKLDCLKPEQKKRIEEELITVKAGKEVLKRVADSSRKKADVLEMFEDTPQQEPDVLDFTAPAQAEPEELNFI